MSAQSKTPDDAVVTTSSLGPRVGRRALLGGLVVLTLFVVGGGGYLFLLPAAGDGGSAPQVTEASADAPLPVSMGGAIVGVRPGDYQIVSIFEGDAIVSTDRGLLHLRVGSSAPGLGEILSIAPHGNGGSVVGTLATLRTL